MKYEVEKLKMLIFALAFAVSSAACGQQTDSTLSLFAVKDTSDALPVDDSLMFKVLGDSICNIILNAKSVEVNLSYLSDSTTSIVVVPMKLDKKQTAVVKFLVSDPKNFVRNTIVYGQFLPNLSFAFFYKKKECKIKFDFGLQKHCVYDNKDNKLGMFDLSSMEMLRFAHTLYPEYDFYVKLLNYK